jgi:probable addiction module antidote protein
MRKDIMTGERARLRDPKYLEAYLQDRLREGPDAFRSALREAVLSQAGGVAGFARRTGLARSGLYKALSAHGNPSYRTVYQVLDALGMRPVISQKAAGQAMSGKTMDQERPCNQTGKAQGGKSTSTDTVHEPHQAQKQRILPGSGKGLFVMSDDFDAPLPEFAEYM